MPSQYLTASDYIAYGLPTTTTDIQVQQASVLIDAYLQRPEGLVWLPDSLGQPSYMAGLEPKLTLNSAGAIAPGSKVTVTLSQNTLIMDDMIGEVVILDRGSKTLVEACVVSGVGQGYITLQSVINSHSANCTIDTGLTIMEQRELPAKRSITRVMRPIVRLLSGMGRYGYGRRTDQTAGMYNEVNLLAAIQTFGGPPLWEAFDPSKTGITSNIRELWIPAGILLAYFSETRLWYVSGWQYSSLPPIIKTATAQIITSLQSNPAGIPSNVKSYQAGQNKIEKFSASLLDNDIRVLLDAYRLVAFA